MKADDHLAQTNKKATKTPSHQERKTFVACFRFDLFRKFLRNACSFMYGGSSLAADQTVLTVLVKKVNRLTQLLWLCQSFFQVRGQRSPHRRKSLNLFAIFLCSYGVCRYRSLLCPCLIPVWVEHKWVLI
jgi:hypothetical protein